MANRQEGTCAVVTGASRGLGLGIARALADSGYRVVMVARDEDALRDAAREIERDGGEAIPVAMDATSPEQARDLIATALERTGRLDVLVNNAGAPPVLRRLESGLTWEEWRRNIDVDVRAVFNTTGLAAPVMRRQQAGTIVNVASGAVVAASPAHVSYTPAQLAIVGMSRCLASDLRGAGVAVHCLCPTLTTDGGVGSIAVEAFASARGLEPGDWMATHGPASPSTPASVGRAVAELASDPALADGVWHVDGVGLARWDLLTAPPDAGRQRTRVARAGGSA